MHFSLFMKSIVDQSTRERMLSHSKAVERVTSVSQQLQITHFNMLIPPTLCGRISNVAVWEKSHWNQITEHVTVGTFLRLRNVHIRKWQGNTFRCKYSIRHQIPTHHSIKYYIQITQLIIAYYITGIIFTKPSFYMIGAG